MDLLFARPAGISWPDQFTVEDRHRLVIEPFTGALAVAGIDLASAGTELLGIA
jgi:putative methionine-R-sulfoxide reductase with GAF domain